MFKKDIVAIGVTKRKNGPYKIKFARNLQARIKRCTPVSDFDLINFVELNEPSDKLTALEFAKNHSSFQDVAINQLLERKYLSYLKKAKRADRQVYLSTSVSDILNAVNM